MNKTQKNILKTAKKEFLKYGFKNASLNEIVKKAGFTKGAFYGYYKNKEALFNALVEETMDKFNKLFSYRENTYCPIKYENTICKLIGCSYIQIVEYIYKNFKNFTLVLSCANGTKYSDFVDKLAKERIKNIEKTTYMDNVTHHMVISGYFTSLFEIVLHNMDKEEAFKYARNISDFYTEGLKSLHKNK